MYTQFYGLREKPFSLSPDPRFLFLSDSHREALAHLLYGIEQGEGFIAITGEVGTGKTTLCRTLLGRLDPRTEVAFVFNPQLSGLELQQAIAKELGLETEGRTRRELMDELNEFLLARRRDGRQVVLIVDEAQALEPEALEQIRLLSNLETDTSKLIQIVLIGQPELDLALDTPNLRQLRQRISVRWRLLPLNSGETREYVRHRMRIAAGASRTVFSELALREVHRRTGGVPRLVNLLCDRVLLAGFGAQVREIGVALVNEAAREIRGSAHPRHKARSVEVGPTRPWLVPAGTAALALLLIGVGIGRRLPALLGDEPEPSVAAIAQPVLPVPSVPATTELPLPLPLPLPPPSEEAIAQLAEPVPAKVEVAQREEPRARNAARALQGRVLPTSGLEADSTTVAAAPPSARPRVEAAKPIRQQLAPAPPPDLATALADGEPGAVMARSRDALLQSWDLEPRGQESLSFEELQRDLLESGFRVWALRSASLAQLEALDRPALLELAAADGVARLVLLENVRQVLPTEEERPTAGDRRVVLRGLVGAPISASSEELQEHWSKRAWVVWREPSPLPRFLLPGATGDAVRWLQRSLRSVGAFEGDPTGEYDLPTTLAVRAFQESAAIPVDGTVGPLTKLRLYERLSDVDPQPRLVRREEAS